MPGQEAGGEPGVKRGLWVALWTAQTFSGGSEVLCPHPYEIKQLKDGRSIPRPWTAVPASQEMRRTCRLGCLRALGWTWWWKGEAFPILTLLFLRLLAELRLLLGLQRSFPFSPGLPRTTGMGPAGAGSQGSRGSLVALGQLGRGAGHASEMVFPSFLH